MTRNAEEGITVSGKFFLFLILGFVFVFAGIIIVLFAAFLGGGGSGNFGAVIFIGPIPIVIGASTDSTLIIVLSVILAVLSVVVFVIMKRRMRRFS